MLAAELIREFLEFHRMDYTLNVYGPESNLKDKTADRGNLAMRAGYSQKAGNDKPILV